MLTLFASFVIAESYDYDRENQIFDLAVQQCKTATYSGNQDHEKRLIQTAYIQGFPKSQFGEEMRLYEFATPSKHEHPKVTVDWRVVRQDEFDSKIVKAFSHMQFQSSDAQADVQEKLNLRMAQFLGKRPPRIGEEWNLYSGTMDIKQATPRAYYKQEWGQVLPCLSNGGDITAVNGCQWQDFRDIDRVEPSLYNHWMIDVLDMAYKKDGHNRFPFTGMGYTFDWGKPNQPVGDTFTDYIGTTEFNIFWLSGPIQWNLLHWNKQETSIEFACRVCQGNCGSLDTYLSGINACEPQNPQNKEEEKPTIVVM